MKKEISLFTISQDALSTPMRQQAYQLFYRGGIKSVTNLCNLSEGPKPNK